MSVFRSSCNQSGLIVKHEILSIYISCGDIFDNNLVFPLFSPRLSLIEIASPTHQRRQQRACDLQAYGQWNTKKNKVKKFIPSWYLISHPHISLFHSWIMRCLLVYDLLLSSWKLLDSELKLAVEMALNCLFNTNVWGVSIWVCFE